MRRYIGYALLTIALLTLIVWAISKFVILNFPPNFNSGVVLFFVALTAVMGVLAQFKDILELIQQLAGKSEQANEQHSFGNLVSGPIQIFQGDVTNVTLNVTYLVQNSSYDSIKETTFDPSSGSQVNNLVPREAPRLPNDFVGRTNEAATLKETLLKGSQTLALVSLPNPT